MRRYFIALLAAAALGSMAFPAVGLAGEQVDICHQNRHGHGDGATWELITVGGRAPQAHFAHDDGVPGGPVPGAPGHTFSADCTPTDTGGAEPPADCYDGAFGNPDLGVRAVDTDDGASMWTSTNGSCTGTTVADVTIVAAADQDEAAATCAAVAGGSPEFYHPLSLRWLYPTGPGDWWLCP